MITEDEKYTQAGGFYCCRANHDHRNPVGLVYLGDFNGPDPNY